MPPPLRLTLPEADYLDATRWRWVLSDSRGNFLADHVVQLDPTSREYSGFRDLSTYLDYLTPIYPPEKQLAELGAWIGEKVFGGLREALWKKRALPAVAVQVVVPEAAQELLFRPFELARFADGKSFREAGVRFVYAIEGTADGTENKEPVEKALRILAAFSLPVRANPLNLRRERYALQRLVRGLNLEQGLGVELRVLQYGATRATLQDALEEAEGWDIIHLSGHGQQGELLLEDDRGGSDTIDGNELGGLLELARARLKLLILDACSSGAGSHAAARVQLGLDREPTHQEGAEGTALAATAQTALPSLAQELSQRLDCAVLAMRYPVGDAFAIDLMLALYEKLLEKRRPLPAALNLALGDAIAADIANPPLSPATPILVGLRAAELQLAPPPQEAQTIALPTVGLSIAFPPEPPRFVGRLQPMLRASQALARRSRKRGVLFHGMPGAGKTACALELGYRHEHGRFQGYVWYRAPEAGSDISNALYNLMHEIQRQLDAPTLGLTTALGDPQHFRQYTLPRLRALLKDNSLLLVLDNLETLLTDSDHWRDPLWGEVVAALLAHDGPSRVVLTSRRAPADLANHAKVQVEPIHALSFAESVLLARELTNLKRLFNDQAGRALLQQTLRVVQGHPKLLELADGLAADRPALAARVAAAANELADRADVLDAFFAAGIANEGETQQTDAGFVRALQGWTADVASGLTPTAGLLFAFLCRLEPDDRRQDIVEITWKHFLARLGEGHAVAAAALAEPKQGLPAALAALEAAGLVGVERSHLDLEQVEKLKALLASHPELAGLDPAALQGVLDAAAVQATTYTIHPGVAEAVRAAAEPPVLNAADIELGTYYIAMFQHGMKTEMEGGGGVVVNSARRAAPYLLRQERWSKAATLLEQMLLRDESPDTVAFALPLLRRIAEATAGTEVELSAANALARTLAKAGRTAEAESLLRDVIARGAAQGNFRVASAAAGELCILLLQNSGRLEEALKVAEETAGYNRQAGLGPWTQLGDEVLRLQVLSSAMGRYDEVLAEVESLRPKMDALPLKSEAEETANPWNVRELLLNTGVSAAIYKQRWEKALALNAEVAKAQEARGASKLELARTHFNDHAPLLRLGRHDDARALLTKCRAVYQAERAVPQLGRVYSALADLEDRTCDRAAAVRFAEVALNYSYQAGEPEDCAGYHHNLSNYLERQGADPATVLAHRLAAATIGLQMQSGLLPTTVRNLAISDLPPAPPAFADVVKRVEAIEGVRFQALFERLPRTAPDGDAALAAVWQIVADEKRRRDENKQRQDAVLAAAPAAVRAAFEREGDEFSAALREALAAMPETEATALKQRLREAGLIQEGSLVVSRVAEGKGNFGYDAITDEYTDLVKAGIIDPAKVMRSALQNAASIRSLLPTSDALIADHLRTAARVVQSARDIDKGWGAPTVTKDGMTVAEEIELTDPYENMGAQLAKEAASKEHGEDEASKTFGPPRGPEPPGGGEPPGGDRPPETSGGLPTPPPRKPVWEGEGITRYPSIEPRGPARSGQALILIVDLLAAQRDEKTEAPHPVRIAGLPVDWTEVPVDYRLDAPDLIFRPGGNEGTILVRRDGASVPGVASCRVRSLGLSTASIEVIAEFYYEAHWCGRARRVIPTDRAAPVANQPPGALPPPAQTESSSCATNHGLALASTRPVAGPSPLPAVPVRTGNPAPSTVEIVPQSAALLVEISQHKRGLSWRLRIPHDYYAWTDLPKLLSGRRSIRSSPEKYFRKHLRPLANGRGGDHLNSFNALGERIWDLTPGVFRRTYWILRNHLGDGFSIQFICDDPSIPWELMRPLYLPEAKKGPPTRLLAMTHPVGRWLRTYETHMPPRRILELGSIVVAASPDPTYLKVQSKNVPAPGVLEVASMLEERYHAARLQARHQAVLDLFQFKDHLELEKKDSPEPARPISVFYFGGHGDYDTEAADFGKVILDDQPLAALEIRTAEVILGEKNRTLVVFNACSTGNAGLVPGGIGGWAEALIHGRFGGFLAPLWPVFDAEARDAMQMFFYEALDGKRTLAEAIREVRKSYGERSPTFLAYVYYGDVDARFEKATTDSSGSSTLLN